MKELAQSETRVIKRSQIHLNPANPKIHKDEDVKKQLKNFKKVGFIGGVSWNEDSGNLLDGHRRIMAQDLYYGYDGTPETDYGVKVEVVHFDRKTELSQLTFMALANTKADYNLVAKYAPEIDPSDAGISDEDYDRIMHLVDREDIPVDMPDYGDEFITPITSLKTDMKTSDQIVEEHANKPKMTVEQVKGEKAKCNDIASNRQQNQDLYVFLSFESLAGKQAFCDLMGFVPTNSMMVKGEDVLRMIE